MNIQLKKFPDTEELIFQTLETFRQIFPTLGNSDGLMLAGGRTPLEIYRRVAEDLSRRSSAKAEGLSTAGQLFLSDERYVPVTDPQSNYGTISPFFNVGQASCLSRQAGSLSYFIKVNTGLPIEAAAQAFHNDHGTISPFFNVGQASCLSRQAGSLSYFIKVNTGLPIEAAAQAFHNDLCKIERIPLGLLGLGVDGHTASLFNLKDAALRDERLALPVIFHKAAETATVRIAGILPAPVDRISVTPTLLHKVEKILILATGAEKKAMIQTLLEKPGTIPAGVALAGHPRVEIWTDQSI